MSKKTVTYFVLAKPRHGFSDKDGGKTEAILVNGQSCYVDFVVEMDDKYSVKVFFRDETKVYVGAVEVLVYYDMGSLPWFKGKTMDESEFEEWKKKKIETVPESKQ
jgi:hypothetical protein